MIRFSPQANRVIAAYFWHVLSSFLFSDKVPFMETISFTFTAGSTPEERAAVLEDLRRQGFNPEQVIGGLYTILAATRDIAELARTLPKNSVVQYAEQFSTRILSR